MRPPRRALELTELLTSLAALTLLISLLAPALTPATGCAGTRRCASNLRSLSLALSLYSDDHDLFPHMAPLDQENSPEMVSAAYRTLLHFRYLDSAETLICPTSDDFFIEPRSQVRADPRRFVWDASSGNDSGREKNPAPIHNASAEPAVLANSQLSYTYIKRKVNTASACSDTMLSADKEIRELDDFSDTGNGGAGSSPSAGNHTEGFNVLYGDGHVAFAQTADGGEMVRLNMRLAYSGSRFDGLTRSYNGD